ncbi:MAG TPA: peptidoglycan-binding domain-containing protein [Oculatellaceae cyanobacterium]
MNNKLAQEFLINWGLLAPPADGAWGPQSQAALEDFQRYIGLKPGKLDAATFELLQRTKLPELLITIDLASKIIRYMLEQSYFISRGPKRYNIVYLEGCDQHGTPNADKLDQWTDRRLLIEIGDYKTPKIIGNWLATTEPGAHYTYNPMNLKGAFRIAFGQYRAWKFGRHGRTQYPALVQVGRIAGYRDLNKDGLRTGDLLVVGEELEINQHHGWGTPTISFGSAGCLVGQSIEGHQDFMNLLRGDRRYKVNTQYVWHTTIIDAGKLT